MQTGVETIKASVVAVEKQSKRVVAVGHKAKKMIGKTPRSIVAYRPLKDGVINEYEVTLKMLETMA